MEEVRLRSRIYGARPIARGGSLRDRVRLEERLGPGRWRKMKGFALVELADGVTASAEVHWYEAHGRGRSELKIKRLLERPR